MLLGKSNDCFITHCFKENSNILKCIITLNTVYFRQTIYSYFAVCELDIALGNHALRTQQGLKLKKLPSRHLATKDKK